MSDNPAQQVLDELFPYFESLETQVAAILQFLRDKGIATDEQLAPYFEKARDASGVKWHAARVRMEHLFAPQPKVAEEPAPTLARTDQKEGAEEENRNKSESRIPTGAAATSEKGGEQEKTGEEKTGLAKHTAEDAA